MGELENVYVITNRIIRKLQTGSGRDPNASVYLPALRDSVGKPLKEAVRVWPLLFETLPKSFLGTHGKETFEEAAIFHSLQIYALGMRGTRETIRPDESYTGSMGSSLSIGREQNESKALDQHFTALITASSYDEFIYHLRHMIGIVQSNQTIVINFAKLAEDLYWYQKGKHKEICFQWATDYYSVSGKTGEQEEDNKNE